MLGLHNNPDIRFHSIMRTRSLRDPAKVYHSNQDFTPIWVFSEIWNNPMFPFGLTRTQTYSTPNSVKMFG